MNRSEVSTLISGDMIECKYKFPVFIVGKFYKVHDTGVGRYVRDERGVSVWLSDSLSVHDKFERCE